MSNSNKLNFNLKGLNWYQLCAVLMCLAALVGSLGYAAQQGIFFNTDINYEGSDFRDAVQSALQTHIGSSWSMTVKPCTFIAIRSGNTFAWGSGTNGSLILPYGTNGTYILDLATGNASIVGGSLFITTGNWTGVSVTLKDDVRLVIDKGATGLTVNADSGATSILENYQDGRISYYTAGSETNYIDFENGTQNFAWYGSWNTTIQDIIDVYNIAWKSGWNSTVQDIMDSYALAWKGAWNTTVEDMMELYSLAWKSGWDTSVQTIMEGYELAWKGTWNSSVQAIMDAYSLAWKSGWNVTVQDIMEGYDLAWKNGWDSNVRTVINAWGNASTLMNPMQNYAYLIGQYANSTYYVKNGTDGTIYATSESSPESDLLNYMDLNSLTGIVYLKDVAHSGTVPEGVTVAQLINGTQKNFVNSANSAGSPYTISTDTVNYYCQDAMLSYINDFTSTSSNTVFSSTFDALPAGRTTKATVKVAQGTYSLTGNISIPSYTTLDLSVAKLLNGADGTVVYIGYYGAGVTDVEIVGGVIDGQRATYTGAGVAIIDSTNVYIHESTIKSCTHWGITNVNSAHTTIESCNVTDIRGGGTASDGMRAVYNASQFVRFIDNTVTDCDDEGISFDDGANNCEAIRNFVNNTAGGVTTGNHESQYGCYNILCAENIITHQTGDVAMGIGGNENGLSYMRNIHYRDNLVDTTAGYGWRVIGMVQSCSSVGDSFNNTKYSAIYVDQEGSTRPRNIDVKNPIVNNVLGTSTSRGIYIRYCDGVTVQGATINNTGHSGIDIQYCTGVSVKSNTVSYAGQNATIADGVYIGSCPAASITALTTHHNNRGGLVLQTCQNSLVNGVTAYDNGATTSGYQVFLWTSPGCALSTVVTYDDYATAKNNYGVRVGVGSDNCSLSNFQITRSGNTGLILQSNLNSVTGGSIRNVVSGSGVNFAGNFSSMMNVQIHDCGGNEILIDAGTLNNTATYNTLTGTLVDNGTNSTVSPNFGNYT